MTIIPLTRLSRDIADFLKFKRALGYSYRRAEHALRSFERFAKRQADPQGRSRINLDSTIKEWLMQGKSRSAFTVALYLGILRQLCLYRRRRDPNGFVPEHALAPQAESKYVPHIFSREEVHRLLKAASQPRRYNAKIQAITVRTLMLVLYCTGLRFGEAVRLSIADVDLNQRLFTIRESKGRTRIVPFGVDLAHEIERYLIERKRCVGSSDTSMSLFVDRHGQPAKLHALSWIFTTILREEGLKPARGRVGARPYDFRHAFAVHRLTDWYRKEYDIHARLPWLSAYMGHLNVLGTEVYLHATPQLLRLASQRFAGRLQSARRIQ
jgi:site-specific recombinase XerD